MIEERRYKLPDEDKICAEKAFLLILHVLVELKRLKMVDNDTVSKTVCNLLGLDREWNEAMCRRDKLGRFALINGGKSGKNQGLKKHKAGSIIKKNAGKRANAKKENGRGARDNRLTEHVRHELNTHLRKDEFEAGETVRCIGDYRYEVEINGFDDYKIRRKEKIK